MNGIWCKFLEIFIFWKYLIEISIKMIHNLTTYMKAALCNRKTWKMPYCYKFSNISSDNWIISYMSVTELLSSMLLTLNYTSSSSSYKISHSNVHNFSIFWIISTQSLLDGMFQIFVLSVPPCINTRTKQDVWLFFCHMFKTLQARLWTTITITYIMVF